MTRGNFIYPFTYQYLSHVDYSRDRVLGLDAIPANLCFVLTINGAEILVEVQENTAAAVVYPNLIWEIFLCVFDGIFV